jgi:YbbR domain-containing protein
LKSEIIEATPGKTEEKQRKKHPNLHIFIICLFISVILWMMIRLSREYTQTVRISAIYKGLQSDKIILPASDTVLYVNMQSTGYNILFRSFNHQKFRIEVDLSQYPAKLQGNNFEINVDPGNLQDQIMANFKQKDKIISYQPEMLKVRLDRAFIKKVPVMLDAELTFAKQYTLFHKIYFDPDSILITGNQDILQSIDFVKTEKRKFNNLSSNISVTLKLVNNNPLNLRYSSEYAKVFIPVVQYEEDNIELELKSDSLAPGMRIITNPEKVKVFYMVCLPDVNKVSADLFQMVVSPLELNQVGNNAKVIVRKSPSFVRILRIEPENVEYTLHKL